MLLYIYSCKSEYTGVYNGVFVSCVICPVQIVNGSIFILVLGWRGQRQLGDRIRFQRFWAHPTQESPVHLPERSWRDDGGCVLRFALYFSFVLQFWILFVPLNPIAAQACCGKIFTVIKQPVKVLQLCFWVIGPPAGAGQGLLWGVIPAC